MSKFDTIPLIADEPLHTIAFDELKQQFEQELSKFNWNNTTQFVEPKLSDYFTQLQSRDRYRYPCKVIPKFIHTRFCTSTLAPVSGYKYPLIYAIARDMKSGMQTKTVCDNRYISDICDMSVNSRTTISVIAKLSKKSKPILLGRSLIYTRYGLSNFILNLCDSYPKLLRALTYEFAVEFSPDKQELTDNLES